MDDKKIKYLKPLNLFQRRQLKSARQDERLRGILETILDVPIQHLPWESLKPYIEMDKKLTLEEVMHLEQVKQAVAGDTTAYKAVLDRAKGKVLSKSLTFVADYKTFLAEAAASEEEHERKEEKQIKNTIDVKFKKVSSDLEGL